MGHRGRLHLIILLMCNTLNSGMGSVCYHLKNNSFLFILNLSLQPEISRLGFFKGSQSFISDTAMIEDIAEYFSFIKISMSVMIK